MVRETILSWCGGYRPALKVSMTMGRVQNVMDTAADAICGMNGVQVLGHQLAFLRSESGTKYTDALDESLELYKKSL